MILPFRFLSALLLCLASTAMGQVPRDVVDETTRWEFVMAATGSVDSSLIRLGDVLRPLQRDMAAWSRLSGATVGLMPIDGSPAQLSRDRLADLISRGQATPTKITIHGPEQITVTRTAVMPSSTTPVQKVAFQSENDPMKPAFSPVVVERLTQWTLVGLKSFHPEIAESFDMTISIHAPTLGTLDQIAGIRSMKFVDLPPVWTSELAAIGDESKHRVLIDGRTEGETCQGELTVHLTPRRAVVVATRSMGRGTRVVEGDVVFRPAIQTTSDDADLEPYDVASPDELIGLEVTTVVRAGIPLSRSQFVAPRLIRRGDLLEVQVSGGGIRVTTAAKSMSDGAAGDLIEIETLDPRRKLLARVISSSLVEVMSQPTQIAKRP